MLRKKTGKKRREEIPRKINPCVKKRSKKAKEGKRALSNSKRDALPQKGLLRGM